MSTTTTTTTTTTEPALAARSRAIESSGWGFKVRLVQPRNFTFWVMTFVFIAGFFNLVLDFGPNLEAYSTPITQGVVWFTVYALAIAWIINRLDRYSPIPGRIRLLAFLWGGVAATFALAIHYNRAIFAILAKTQGISFSNDWKAALSAPISEEIAKGLAVVVLIGVAPRIVRTATDGFIIGAFSGLAFQVFEDVMYVLQSTQAAFGQSEAGINTAFTRTILGFSGHWMWTAIFCAGFVYLIGRPMQPARPALGIFMMLLTPIGHFLWNGAAPLLGNPSQDLLMLTMIVLTAVITVIFVAFYRMTLPPEKQTVRDILQPEVDAGLMTGDELEALVARYRERRRFIKAAGGRAERRSRRHVLEASHDLADRIATARGLETDEVQHARAELARMRT
jgi:RsiW-degrading membrane proteinase PrsW (M82 family)